MSSQVSKLNYVNSKLGAPTFGQQTTRTIFHTLEQPANSRSYEFFQQFQGLTPGQTNLTTNKLDSDESMVIKTISLMRFVTGTGIMLNFSNREPSTLTIEVGNQKVVKDLPLFLTDGFASAPFDRLHANAGGNLYDFAYNNDRVVRNAIPPIEIRLLTDIVIPPQVAFKVTVNFSTTQTTTTDTLVCALSGYGKIFSAGASF
jgi:hypothetical protein